VAREARELQGSSAHSMKSAEWSLSDGLLYFRGKIYVLDTSDLRCCIIALSHDSRLASHSGTCHLFVLAELPAYLFGQIWEHFDIKLGYDNQ